MIVFRLDKPIGSKDSRFHKNDTITNEGWWFHGNEQLENCLEEYRIQHHSELHSRQANIFVFPDNNVEKRALHWGRKYLRGKEDKQTCFLLKLEIDEDDIQWHDSKILMNYIIHQGQLLDTEIRDYWAVPKSIESIDIEGLVTHARVLCVSKCKVENHKFSVEVCDIDEEGNRDSYHLI